MFKILTRLILRRGDRVSTTLSSGNNYEGKVVGYKFPFILVDFDEFPNVPGVPFYRRELRKLS